MLLRTRRGAQKEWARLGGDGEGRGGGRRAGARQVVKQISRGEHEKNKENRKREMGPQRRKSSTKQPR